MNRNQVIARLEELEPVLRTMGAEGLHLFGSAARGHRTSASDVDLFIDVVPGQSSTLLDLAAVQRLLGDRLAARADLTTRDSLHPFLKDSILAEAIRTF